MQCQAKYKSKQKENYRRQLSHTMVGGKSSRHPHRGSRLQREEPEGHLHFYMILWQWTDPEQQKISS